MNESSIFVFRPGARGSGIKKTRALEPSGAQNETRPPTRNINIPAIWFVQTQEFAARRSHLDRHIFASKSVSRKSRLMDGITNADDQTALPGEYDLDDGSLCGA